MPCPRTGSILVLTLACLALQDAVNSGEAITNGAYNDQGLKNVQ